MWVQRGASGAEQLTYFAVALAVKRLPGDTIQGYIWGIGEAHVDKGLEDPTKNVRGLMDMLTGIRKLQPQHTKRRKAVKKEHLQQLAQVMDLGELEPIRNMLLWCVLYSTVSRSEWSLPKTQVGFDPDVDLCIGDVIPVLDRNGSLLTIAFGAKHAKADPYHEAMDESGRHWHYCGVGDLGGIVPLAHVY